MFDFATWLYSPWSKEKLGQFEFLSNVPLVGDYMNYLLDVRADEEYLRRYGMDYSDIHDPRKLRQTGSGSRMIGGQIEFVSSNVTKLYGKVMEVKREKERIRRENIRRQADRDARWRYYRHR